MWARAKQRAHECALSYLGGAEGGAGGGGGSGGWQGLVVDLGLVEVLQQLAGNRGRPTV